MFKDLDDEQETEYRLWAREHHDVGDAVSTLWHPVIRDECQLIDEEE